MECFMPQLDFPVLLQPSHDAFPFEAMPISPWIAKIHVKMTSSKRGRISLACSCVDTCITCANKTCGHVFDKGLEEHVLEMYILCVFSGVWGSPEERGRKDSREEKSWENFNCLPDILDVKQTVAEQGAAALLPAFELSRLQRLLCFHPQEPGVGVGMEELSRYTSVTSGKMELEHQDIRVILGYPSGWGQQEILTLRPTTQMSEEELRGVHWRPWWVGQRYGQTRDFILWSKTAAMYLRLIQF